MRRALAQVFLRPRGGRLEALLVIELETGARERTTLPLASDDPRAAARMLGRHLAREGTAARRGRFRLRVERGGDLHDDTALAEELLDAHFAERRAHDDDS